MASRTLQFLGNGYAPTGTDAAVEVTFNGNSVFTGTIPTIHDAGEPLKQPEEMQPLFTVVLPITESGVFPMIVKVIAGDQVDLTQILTNHNNDTDNVFVTMGTGSKNRSDVVINGVPQPDPDPEVQGEWTWSIPEGGTMTSNIHVSSILSSPY